MAPDPAGALFLVNLMEYSKKYPSRCELVFPYEFKKIYKPFHFKKAKIFNGLYLKSFLKKDFYYIDTSFRKNLYIVPKSSVEYSGIVCNLFPIYLYCVLNSSMALPGCKKRI